MLRLSICAIVGFVKRRIGKRKVLKKGKKKADKHEKVNPSKPLENIKWELFCQLYVGANDKNLFGHGTNCYMHAYGSDEKELELRLKSIGIQKGRERGYSRKIGTIADEIKRIRKVAQVEATRLLSKVVISARIDKLLNSLFSDDFADNEMAYVIGQRFDLNAKVAAYKEYNKLKQRVTEKIDITTKGKAIDGIEIITPNKKVDK